MDRAYFIRDVAKRELDKAKVALTIAKMNFDQADAVFERVWKYTTQHQRGHAMIRSIDLRQRR